MMPVPLENTDIEETQNSFVAGNSIGSMSQYHEEVEEMGDDYEMGEAGDETGDEYQERVGRDSDSDDEEFGHSV